MVEQRIEIDPGDDRSDVEKVADNLQITEDDAEDLVKGWEELRSAAGIVFQIYRTEPTDKAGFCTEYPSAQFTQTKLAREWGPGTYRIRIKGEGGRYIRGGGTIRVAASELPEIDPRLRVPEQSQVSDMLALLRADREKQSSNLKEWAAIIGPLAAPILANLFTQKKETVADMVGALAALKQLEPQAPKPPDALAEIDRVSALLERAKELGGGGTTTGATWVDVLRDGLAGVKDLIASGAVARFMPNAAHPLRGAAHMIPYVPSVPSGIPPAPASVSPPPPPNTATNTGAAGSESSTTPATTEDPMLAKMLALLPWLRMNLESLVYQASRNKDPGLYVDVTLDNLPDGADVRQLLEFLESPEWWQKLQTFYPQVLPYAGWFSEFRDGAVKEIKKLIAGPDGEGS